MLFWVLLLCSLGVQTVILKEHIMYLFRVKELSQVRSKQSTVLSEWLDFGHMFLGLEINWGQFTITKKNDCSFVRKHSVAVMVA
jgi:hypothetical protein